MPATLSTSFHPNGYVRCVIEPWAYPVLTATAIVSGFVDAVAGGGALIAIPALLYAGVPPLHALGTNKLQSLFGNATALGNYARFGFVDWRRNGLTMLVVFVGGALGALAVQSIDTRFLNVLIPVLLVLAALYVLLSPRMTDEDAHQRLTPGGYAPVGGVVAFYDGFFGPGASTFFATSLVALRGYGLTRATALTKLLNFIAVFASVILFALGGHLLWLLGLCMAVGAIIGGWLGSRSAMRFGARLIRPLIVLISIGMTARLLWSYFKG